MRASGPVKSAVIAVSLVVAASATAVASVPRSTVDSVAQDRAAITDAAAAATLPDFAPGPETALLTAAQIKSARSGLTAELENPQKSKAQKKAKAKSSKKESPLTNTGPIPTASSASSGRIQRLVKTYFPASQLGNAMAVAACESGHSDAVGAVNNDGTVDWGVFQLNDGGTLQGSLNVIGASFDSKAQAQKLALNTETNVKAAASIYASRGWAPWVCAYKIRIVASLYGNSPGPMAGKFDDMGNPTVSVPTIPVGPAPTQPKLTKEPKPKASDSAKSPSSTDTPTKKPTKPAKPSTPPAPSATSPATPSQVPPQPVPREVTTKPAQPPAVPTDSGSASNESLTIGRGLQIPAE
jgi:hypothetical protein